MSLRKKAVLKSRQLGQGMTEYIIIVALIAIAAIGAFGFFGDTVEHQVAGMSSELSGDAAGATAEIGLAQTASAGASTAAAQHKNLGNYDANSQSAAGGN